MTDEKLVEEAIAALPGDFRAFDKLVIKHQSMVRTNCRYISGSEDDAQDLAQEVFVKAYFNLAGFQGKSQFSTWVKRIKVNHCLNHLRRQKGKIQIDIETPGLSSDVRLQNKKTAAFQAEATEKNQLISTTLDGLNENLRVPLIMRDMDGISYQEIADHLNLGLSAVKMRINRARREFRTCYLAMGGDLTHE
ncbi:MAG: sigma-70 family RNA polymerase sigma factor [bacterium]|nr:sigma-70 family RNA polymerase sigma factor [bacterium]